MKNLFLSGMVLILLLGCTGPVEPPAPTIPPSEAILTVQNGDRVAVDYVGTLEDGSIFDTNLPAEAEQAGLSKPTYQPFGFTVGSGQLIDGFDQGVLGMREGEERNLTIPPSQAYGPIRETLIVTVPKEDLPFTVGLGAVVETSDGLQGTVTTVQAENVTVNFNHPLAGKTLHFRVVLRSISRS